jgi:hypothetical protein
LSGDGVHDRDRVYTAVIVIAISMVPRGSVMVMMTVFLLPLRQSIYQDSNNPTLREGLPEVPGPSRFAKKFVPLLARLELNFESVEIASSTKSAFIERIIFRRHFTGRFAVKQIETVLSVIHDGDDRVESSHVAQFGAQNVIATGSGSAIQPFDDDNRSSLSALTLYKRLLPSHY